MQALWNRNRQQLERLHHLNIRSQIFASTVMKLNFECTRARNTAAFLATLGPPPESNIYDNLECHTVATPNGTKMAAKPKYTLSKPQNFMSQGEPYIPRR